jgi:hypothetical protein
VHTAENYRLDEQTHAALAFLRWQDGQPFFLFVNHYAPHVPLIATGLYLASIQPSLNLRPAPYASLPHAASRNEVWDRRVKVPFQSPSRWLAGGPGVP